MADLNDSLSIEWDGDLYRVYPTNTHWVLIKESMAAEILVKLCKRERGVNEAVTKAMKYILESE